MTKLLSAAAVLAVFIIGSQVPVYARTSCTNADLSGSYAVTSDGIIPGNGPLAGPHARVGSVIFDGNGKLNVTAEYSSYDGYMFNAPYSGTYIVNSDCTLTMTGQLVDLTKTGITAVYTPATFNGTLDTDTLEIRFILASPAGATVSGTATKIKMTTCSTASLAGDFEFDMTGYFIGAPLGGPFRRIGKLSADGVGNFSATTTADYNGQIVPESFTGTYTVDQSCTVTMIHQLDGVNVTLIGPVNNAGNGAYVIVSGAALAGPGTPVLNALIGTLRAQ